MFESLRKKVSDAYNAVCERIEGKAAQERKRAEAARERLDQAIKDNVAATERAHEVARESIEQSKKIQEDLRKLREH